MMPGFQNTMTYLMRLRLIGGFESKIRVIDMGSKNVRHMMDSRTITLTIWRHKFEVFQAQWGHQEDRQGH